MQCTEQLEGRYQLRYSDRICPPEQTLTRVTPLLDRYGVTRVARITELDCIGIPVWNTIRPNACSIVIHQGKGISDTDARVSAVMEALERAVAEDPDIPSVRASRNAVEAGGVACDPLSCLIAAHAREIDRDTVVDWFEGIDLIGGASVWVPREAAILDQTQPSRFWQCSDGLASGNTAEEAIFHGTLERIERDAEVLWQLENPDKRAGTCVDARSYDDPVINSLLEKIERAGFRIQLFDMTSDFDIPVFNALLAQSRIHEAAHARYIDVTHGSGAHPIAVRAIIRSITEAAQSRLTLISGARDDVTPFSYDWPMPEGLRHDLALAPRADRRADSAPTDASLTEMLDGLLKTFTAKKLGPLIAVRLNPEETRMAVVKMIAPQLENPEGSRRQSLGKRALAKVLVFR